MGKSWLLFADYAVDEAVNGADAVRQAQLAPPDLILMDLWMPVLDGVSAMRQLRADPATAQVPVIALSAQSTTPTADEMREAGFDVVLGKAVGAEALIAEIHLLLRPPPNTHQDVARPVHRAR